MNSVFAVIDPVATGAQIRNLRRARHLTVRAVADYMGFTSEQAVYKWQRGESLPTLDNIYALSGLFGTSIDNIIRGSKERDDEPSLFLRSFLGRTEGQSPCLL